MSEPKTEPSAVRDTTPAPGSAADPAAPARRHWRTLAELSGDPAVRELREREFLTPSEEVTEPSRRDFLKLIGAGAAFAAAGCSRKPVEKILPYIRMPEEANPGKAVWYASTCGEC
ncbi:MAG: twin-arginine translocation signal domain-containing protein, partial [Candidatus Eisenbacteria bacterium]